MLAIIHTVNVKSLMQNLTSLFSSRLEIQKPENHTPHIQRYQNQADYYQSKHKWRHTYLGTYRVATAGEQGTVNQSADELDDGGDNRGMKPPTAKQTAAVCAVLGIEGRWHEGQRAYAFHKGIIVLIEKCYQNRTGWSNRFDRKPPCLFLVLAQQLLFRSLPICFSISQDDLCWDWESCGLFC